VRIAFGLNEAAEVAAQIWAAFPKAKVFFLYGDLGVGKSTLVREMLRQKGIEDAVPSPTFALVQSYADRYHHMDLYRIKSYEEFGRAGLEELLETGVCFVEWPEILEGRVEAVKIKLEYADENAARVLYICDDNQR
jgi:tRNA threonylcarbamoyl adenosine modification protein YjeE